MLLEKLSALLGAGGPPAHVGTPPENVLPDSDAELAREALRGVIDPEVGINVVDLGLIYGIHADPGQVAVTMTMTTPACPLTGLIRARAEEALEQVLPGRAVEVRFVWDPPWSPARMSPDARDMLGLP